MNDRAQGRVDRRGGQNTRPPEPRRSEWERRYARLAEASQSLVFRMSPLGILREVRPPTDQISGWPIAEWLAKPVLAFLHPDDAKVARAWLERVLAGESSGRETVRILTPAGETRQVEVTVVPEETGGKIVGLLGVANDVTGRRRAEERAARLERQLLAAQAITRLGSWEWDLASGQVTWSDELYRIYGYEPQAFPITFERFLGQVHPEDRERVRSVVAGALERSEPFSFDERVVAADGSTRVLQSRGERRVEPDGRVSGLIGTCRDVTVEREREEALERAKREYQHLVQSVQAIVWRGDPRTFRFSFVSREAETLLGYPVSRWLDEPSFWIDHVHPDDREWAKSFCARTSAEGRDHAFELRMIAADGRVVWLRDVVRTITEGGRPKENVGVMIDITERRQAEEELRRSRQQLSDLSAHVEWAREEERTAIAREVHDELGQALTALKMDVALLGTRLQQDPPAVADALGRLGAMSELVEDTIHRVRRIAHELRPGVLDDLGLDAALEWAGQDFEARTGIACRVLSGLGERRLPRDLATAFFRIFQEALTNVARHARARGVAVRLEHRGGRLTLEVTDDGCGIAEEAIAGAKSLGLLGMRERARRLGGDVVIAAAPGRGTTVSLSVPFEPGSEQA